MLQLTKIALLSLILTTIAFAQTNWIGEYEFYEDGGKTAGGTKIFVSHVLKITKKGDKLKAHLTGNGYMTYLDIYADAKIEGNKIKLLFRNLGDKNSMGSYLEKGDLLLVLEKQKRGGKTQILTHWKNYTPGFEKHEASGKVYFEKINNNASVSNL